MQIIIGLIIFFTSTFSRANFSLEDALIGLKKDVKKTLLRSEKLFDQEENFEERGKIAYFFTLDPGLKLKKSRKYYFKVALRYYKELNSAERYRLTRTLADLEFEKGNLKTALSLYDQALSFKESEKLKDYLTLQKFWVLVNLNKYKDALGVMKRFLAKNSTSIAESMAYDYGKIWAEGAYLNVLKHSIDKELFKKYQKSILNGIFSGHLRVLGKRSILEKELTFSKIYDDFFFYGLKENKFPSNNICELLEWKCPSILTNENTDLYLEKINTCLEKRKDKVLSKRAYDIFNRLYSKKYQSIAFAKTAKKFDQTKSCEILGALSNDEKNYEASLVRYAKYCLGSGFNKNLYPSLVKNINKKVSSDLLLTNQFNKYFFSDPVDTIIKEKDLLSHLLSLYYFEKKDVFKSLYLKNLKTINKNKGYFIYQVVLYKFYEKVKLSNDEKTILSKVYLKLNNIKRKNIVKLLINSNEKKLLISILDLDHRVIEDNHIFSHLVLNHELLLDLKRLSNPILAYFQNKRSYFSRRDFQDSKSKVSKEISSNLVIFRHLFNAAYAGKKLNTDSSQESFFFKIESLVKKLSKTKWKSNSLKTRAFSDLESLLMRSIKKINRNKTLISSQILKVLENYRSKAKTGGVL